MTSPLYESIETAMLAARDSEHLRRIRRENREKAQSLTETERRHLNAVFTVKLEAMLHFRSGQ
jgi:hypothetical protein